MLIWVMASCNLSSLMSFESYVLDLSGSSQFKKYEQYGV